MLKAYLHPKKKPNDRLNVEKAAPWCVGSNLERYKWKAPEVSDSSPHTCPTTIRLWHDQHPPFQFGRCSPMR
jgi:hypothetical protein